MYLFLVLALPLGYLLLSIGMFPAEEGPLLRRELTRGMALSPLAWILSLLFAAIVPEFYGTPFLIASEWANRTLPYAAAPLLCYALFHRLDERLPPGRAERRVLAFYAGCLSPLCLAEAARSWHSPDLYLAIMLPLVTAAFALVTGPATLALALEYGWRRAIRIAALVLASLAAAVPRWLLLCGLWPLALLLAVLTLGAAWLYAAPRIARRAPEPLGA
jgi:hypothetical protein